MKKIYILLLLLISCSVEKDSTISIEDNPKTEDLLPTMSSLIFPLENSECLEGKIISEKNVDIEFSWNPSQNTNSYSLVVKNLTTNVVNSFDTTETTYMAELERGTPYSWYVISKSENTDKTAQSIVWKFYTMGINVANYPPFPPELINPIYKSELNSNNNQINLSWNAQDIEDENLLFKILLDTSNPPSLNIAENITENNFNILLEESNTYYWRVLAQDTKGNTSISDISEFKYIKQIEKSSNKSISSFSINYDNTIYEGIINDDLETIELTLGNFDYEKLIPEIKFSDNASISPKNQKEQNFLDKLYYTVTAEDGSTKVYDIIIKSGQHEILSFEVFKDDQRYIGFVNNEQSTININLGDFDYSSINPIIEYSKKASISPENNSIQNFNHELLYTVTSEIGTSKTFKVVAPIALTNASTFFGQANCDFSPETINKDFIVYAGSELYFSALNVQNIENLSIVIENENNSYPLIISETFFNNNVYNGVSDASNYIKTIIPYSLQGGTYSFKIYDNYKEAVYSHEIQVINDQTTIKISGINQTDFTRDETIILTGENLTKNFIIKSNGNQYVFNESNEYVTINESKTEVKILLSSNIYSNLKTWSGSNEKSLAMNTYIDGYEYLINSNTIYFNIN